MAKTYPSTRAELRARVYDRLLGSATAQHSASDSKINSALNDAQREVQSQLVLSFDSRFFTKTDDGLSPANNRIKLPADFRRPIRFDRQNGTTGTWESVTIIPPAHYQDFTWPWLTSSLDLRVAPEQWSIMQDTLVANGGAAVSGTYRLIYQYAIPDLQADDQQTEIPEEYQEMLVDYAAWVMETDAGNAERAAPIYARYERRLEQMRQTASLMSTKMRSRIRRVRNWRIF